MESDQVLAKDQEGCSTLLDFYNIILLFLFYSEVNAFTHFLSVARWKDGGRIPSCQQQHIFVIIVGDG